MITELFGLVFLVLVYGLAWHQRSAREPIGQDNPRTKRNSSRPRDPSAS